MKSNYAELQRRSAVNYGDTECKYKLYVDYAKEENTVIEDIIEVQDSEVEEHWDILGCIVLLVMFTLFCWDKGLVYIRV